MEDSLIPVSITVNGTKFRRFVKTSETLLEFLREDLQLKGTKYGCNNGECGACSVILNDELVYSCHVLAAQADGAEGTTIEGFNSNKAFHPIQTALMDEGAIQCGYCTPGMVLAIKKLLDEFPDPTDAQIRFGLSGNICRCTGYASIERAVKVAAKEMRGEA